MPSARGGTSSLVGLLTIALGGWLIDSAVQNRPPIATLKLIVQDPKNTQALLASMKGLYDPNAHTASAPPVGSFTPSSAGGTPATGGGQAAAAVQWARTQIGKPYAYGKTGPNSYDCSGLVQAAGRAVGVPLPRTTFQQILVGTPVSRTSLAIGDLVFPDPGHVQLYSGNGNVVEAPHTGTNVREVPMWGFMAARRVFSSSSSVSV